MKGLVLVTGDDGLRREAAAYCACLGIGFSNELPVTRLPDWALAADLGLLAPLASGLPNQDLSKVFAQVVALSADDGFHARMQAVRVGATGFLRRPVMAADICDLLDDSGVLCADEAIRVLIVDDDPIAARVTGRQMELAGMEVLALQDASKSLDSIHEFRPDIAILDLYMPMCSGTELAQVIRQISAFQAMPIIFLSSEGELAAQMNAVSSGGDDFVAKGTPGALMIPLIRSRAARMRRITRHLRTDAATGLLSHGQFKEALAAGITTARREDRELAVTLIDLDGFRDINDAHGHDVGDGVVKGLARLLRHRLAPGQLAGRFAGQQFGVILPDLSVVAAAAQLDELRQTFAGMGHAGAHATLTATFSAGVVGLDGDDNVESVMARAREQVHAAKAAGRNRISALSA